MNYTILHGSFFIIVALSSLSSAWLYWIMNAPPQPEDKIPLGVNNDPFDQSHESNFIGGIEPGTVHINPKTRNTLEEFYKLPEEKIPLGVKNNNPTNPFSRSHASKSIGGIEPGIVHINTFDVTPKHETLVVSSSSRDEGVKFNIETVPDALPSHLQKPSISQTELIQNIQTTLASTYNRDMKRKKVVPEMITIEAMSQHYTGGAGEKNTNNKKKLVQVGPNGMIQSLVTAFAQHLPIVLSPDHIWIAISYAFAKHIDLNAETLRKNFVQHKGKKRLEVYAPFSMSNGTNPDHLATEWENLIFPEFSKQIKDHIGEINHETIAASFSTTTNSIKAAYEITLMSAMKNYFSYGMTTACGIPHVTLLGTESDWVNLRTRAEKIGTLMTPEFSAMWMPLLLPVLDQFVQSYKGVVDYGFWQSMVKLRSTSGSGAYSFISGWIQILFPYLATGREPTDEINRNLRPWQEMYFSGPGLNEFPLLLSTAPVDWDYLGVVYNLDFYAGIIGFEQDVTDGALSPVLGWYVSHTPPYLSKEIQIREYQKEVDDLTLALEGGVLNNNANHRILFLKKEINRLRQLLESE